MADDIDTEENGEEVDLGIPNDTPDEIMDFVKRNDVADKYTVMLKRKPEGGGVAGTLRSFTNYYPNVNTIGKEWGPGSYELVFSWRGLGLSGKKETITRGFKLELPVEAWLEVHEDYLAERAEARRKKEEIKWQAEAAKIRAQGGTVGAGPTAPVSELDSIRKALEMAKSLGVPIGGKQEKTVEKKSFAETMISIAPAITAIGAIVSPIAVALISRPKKDDSGLLNTLLAHVLTPKPQENEMIKQFVPFLMGTMKQVFEMKESMQPEEKQGWVEKIFDKLAPMIPAVVALAAQSPAQRDANPLVGMAKNHPDMKTVQDDPELQALAVEKLDRTYGFQQANQVLEVLGIVRPPELADNYRKWPTKGWRTDGTHESAPPVSDGRGAKQADGAVTESEDVEV